MAKGKVSREGPSDAFAPLDTQSNLDPDTAIVGEASDGVEIDLDTEDDDKEANWDLPAGAKPPASRQETRQEESAGEFDEEDSRLAYSDDPREQEDDENKPSHRRRRNERRRQAQTKAEQEIASLREQLQELGGVVRTLATGQTGLAANTLEGQIVQLQNSLRLADEEMANAVKNSDGDTYTKAQNIRDQIVGRLWGMKNKHAELMRSSESNTQEQQPARREGGGQAPQREAPRVDPMIVSAVEDRFNRFQDRFPWFDPESPDADCNIVRSIDGELVARGYQRHTPHFWEQMERKMATYGLTPQRGGGGDDQEDDTPPPPRRQQMSNGGRARPPTGNGRAVGNGRNNASNSLNEMQVGMLRDEGLLEDKLSEEDIAKRDRILAKWKRGNESLRRGAR